MADYIDISEVGAVAGHISTALTNPDCTSIISNIIASGKSVYLPRVPNGYGYRVTSLQIPGWTKIFGPGSGLTAIHHTGGLPLFEIQNHVSKFEGFSIDSTKALPSSCEFKIKTSIRGIEQISIKDIFTHGSYGLISDDAHATNIFTLADVDDVKCRAHRGYGVDYRNAWAYITLNKVTVDYTGSGIATNNWAFQFRNNAGLDAQNCDVTGVVNANTSNNVGFFFFNCVAGRLTKLIADTVAGHGFYMYGQCVDLQFTDCKASLVGDSGFVINNYNAAGQAVAPCQSIHLNDCTIYGRQGLSYAPANKFAIWANGAEALNICGGRAQSVTSANPINLTNCTKTPTPSINIL